MAENEGTMSEDEETACPHCGKKIKTKTVVKGFSVICLYCDSPI